uniref:NADH dehydrogenase subunit 2 n=1 Tax=Imasa heleensis TaxID=2772037 RepID=A0A893DCI3_9EUKA|nr:NADH dehydrogenase subunit 2 [Imasa heleensis]QRR29742.1 NADH dehydrogenase subunit 2 [Imasa heleensis]
MIVNYNNILNNSFKVLSVESFLLISITALIVFFVYISNSYDVKDSDVVRVSIGLGIILVLICIGILYNNPFLTETSFNHTFISNQLTGFIKIIVLLSTLCILFYSLNYSKKENFNNFEYVILIILAVVGMMLMVSSFDFLTIYLSLELQSLSFYILASMKRDSEYSTEASFKYFILGAFSSGFLLFGFSLMYGLTGTTNIEQLYHLFYHIQDAYSNLLYVAIIFILVGLLFKLGAAPFHMWVPDVYEGSPTIITSFFAIVPKVVIITLIFRLFSYAMYELSTEIQQLLVICSMFSMIIPSFVALVQTRIKRLFAYSTVAHVGYILMGVSTGTLQGVQSTLMYLIIYIVMSIGLFGTILSIRKKSNNIRIKYINELSNLSKMNPTLALTLTLIVFSMAGIPPLAGFFGKLYVFGAAIDSHLYFLTIVGVLTSVVSSVYYIYIIKIMYFEKDKPYYELSVIDKPTSVLLGMSFLFIILFIFYAEPLLLICHEMSYILTL